MRKALGIVAVTFVFSAPLPAHAELSQARLQRLLRHRIQAAENLAESDRVVADVRRQNDRKVPLAEIKRLDAQWAASKELTPLKKSVLENEVARHFRSLVTFDESIYSEIFLTDRQGATIAAYPLTSDYWQGDEEKWSNAFAGGKGTVYVGPVMYDESSKTDAVQISVPVFDGEKAIGVLVVGIKLSYIQAHYLKERD